jgi:hypothetical protein
MKNKQAHIEKVLSAIHGTNQNPEFLLDTGPPSEDNHEEISINGSAFGEALFWIYSNPEEGKTAALFRQLVDFTWSKYTLNQTDEFKFWTVRNVVNDMFDDLQTTLQGSYLESLRDHY